MISATLVARIASGDRSAEQEIYERYARAVVFILRRRGADPDEAEDICHETFITAYAKLRPDSASDPADDGEPGIRKSRSLAAFLQGIAINKLIGERRKARRQDTRADTEAIERAIADVRGPFDEVASEQLRQTLRTALGNLPVERDRDILDSVLFRDEDRASIQQRLGIDANHFNRVLYRAKERLVEEVGRLLATRGAKVTDLREFAAERHY